MWGVRYSGGRGSSGGRLGAISYHWNLRLRLGWALFPAAGDVRLGGPAALPLGDTQLCTLPMARHSLELTVINQVLCIGEIQHLVPLG